jgi:hypothetical protein
MAPRRIPAEAGQEQAGYPHACAPQRVGERPDGCVPSLTRLTLRQGLLGPVACCGSVALPLWLLNTSAYCCAGGIWHAPEHAAVLALAPKVVPSDGLISVSLWDTQDPDALKEWLDENLGGDCVSEISQASLGLDLRAGIIP